MKEGTVKVYVIWDPAREEVVSVHSTESGCQDECNLLDNMPGKYGGPSRTEEKAYHFEYEEFEVKE